MPEDMPEDIPAGVPVGAGIAMGAGATEEVGGGTGDIPGVPVVVTGAGAVAGAGVECPQLPSQQLLQPETAASRTTPHSQP
jgi:hypothetical protein